MKSKIKDVMCVEPDEYLFEFSPKEKDYFGVTLEMYIGPEDSIGEELFRLELCTPRWFRENNTDTNLAFIKNFIFVQEYNYDKIWELLKNTFEIFDEDWNSIDARLSRFAYWEFEYL